MDKIKTNILTILLWCLLGQAGLSQQAGLVYQGIEENRTVNNEKNCIEITTRVQGLELDDNHLIRLKDMTITDDSGNTLAHLEETYYLPIYHYSNNSQKVLRLEAPSRKARQISVKGTIEYFTISEDLHSKRNFTDIQQQYHKNLLAGNDATMVLIDLEGLSRLKKEDEAGYSKKVRQLHKNAGVGTTLEHAKRYLDNALADYGLWHGEATKQLHLYREDPNNNILDVKVYKNNESQSGGASFGSNTFSYSLKEGLTPEMELQFIVKNDSAIKKIPFTLTVNLP